MDERIEALFPFYALDAVTTEERQEVEAYLAQQPDAQARLASYMGAAELLPYAADPIAPAAQVKSALMSRVTADLQPQAAAPPAKPESPSLWARIRQSLTARPATTLAGGLALAAILLLLFWSGSLRTQMADLSQENVQLQSEVSTQEEQLAELQTTTDRLQDELSEQQETVQTLSETNEQLQEQLRDQETTLALFSQAIPIAGTDAALQASGQLIHAGGETAVLTVSGLSALSPESTYQFWLIDEQMPHPAGLFNVDANGEGQLVVEAGRPIDSFLAFGVSIEPASGSEQPTGDIVLLSG